MRFVIGLIAIGLLAACGGGSNQNSAVVSQSPSSDQVTMRYLDLVRGFWSDYLDAENKGTEASAPVACIQEVDMKVCADRVKEMIPVLQKFLTDLGSTPAPVKFATDDANFRHELPIAIADLNLVLSAAIAKDKATFSAKVDTYIRDMIPAVTGSLDDVDPTVTHN